ncbi:MAG: hypothetical protein PHU77_00015 [Simplicispira sp.]|nr:hypothetical protein [Simplicispira sp.]
MTAALSALLLASLTINAGQAWLYMGQRDKAAIMRAGLRTAEQERDGARDLASACSRAVDGLRTVSDKRATAAAPARAAAATVARTLTKRADTTLASAPAVPGDMCASMQALGDDWLESRTKP